MRCLAALACIAWLAACVPAASLPPVDGGPPVQTVAVVSNGWHTAIVVPRPALAATGLLPEAEDFPDAAYLEFGWGDRVYYPDKEPSFGMALGAALTPSPSVMHVAARRRAPNPKLSDVVSVALSQSGFEHMVGAIGGEFVRPAGGRAAPVADGLYKNSKFYDAKGSFHLFNTCNTWSARMLRAGGVKLPSSGIVTADDLMGRLRKVVGSD